MIYCNLRGYTDPKKPDKGAQMTVSQLFSSGPVCDDVDSALAKPITNIPYCEAVQVDNFLVVEEGFWFPIFNQNVSVGYLTCCAAVLIYDYGSNLIMAGHPAGGHIDEGTTIDIDQGSIGFAIYATPDLKPKEPTFANYRKSIEWLAIKCGGMNKVCFLDGFKYAGSVLANSEGGLIFPKFVPEPPKKAES